MTNTNKQLILDKEELHSRLVDLEETLNAIRSGEVDAIMVPGKKGEQVYSLSTAETPYRTFVEEMNEGALTLDKEGLILFCNKKFAELVKEPADRVIGSYFNSFLTPDDSLKLNNFLVQLENKQNNKLTVSLLNSLFLKLSFRLMPSYLQGEDYIVIATDISELKKKEIELLEMHRLLKHRIVQSKELRIDLINAKIEANTQNHKLKNTNEKLVKEIASHKRENEELKQKVILLTKEQ